MKSNFKFEKGFTLIEILTSIVVLVAVSSILAGIMTSSLRGTNKADVLENIRQNGNYVINQLSKEISFAQPFDGINTGLGTINTDQTITYIASCYIPSPSPAPLINAITVQSKVNGALATNTYRCEGAGLSVEGISPVKPEIGLVDYSSVAVSGCSFACIQNKITDTPIIKIKFTLSQKEANPLAEKSGTVTFETSVTLRNYRKL